MTRRADNRSRFAPSMIALAAGAATVVPALALAAPAAGSDGDGDTMVLAGIVRDFNEHGVGGHVDFERYPCAGFGHYVNIVEDELSDDGLPVFRSTGCLVSRQSTDSRGNSIINPRDYIESRPGDALGVWNCFGDSDDGHECDGEHDVEIAGMVNLNPNNSRHNEFQLVLPDGSTLDRDDLHSRYEGYTGPAVSAFIMPKGNGNQNELTVDGETYPLRNGSQYYITAPEMRVRVFNDNYRNGRAMGHWWIQILDGDNATISEDPECVADRTDDGCDSPYPGGGAVYSPDSFAQWYTDIPGTNVSKQVEITLTHNPLTDTYVFDDTSDALYRGRGGFFPIDADLYGNSEGSSHNYHFTYEVRTSFQFREDRNDFFTFRGDDDLWVFIDGRLVIDVGGIHSAVSQTIEINRLGWLEEGETYELAFFFAERHRVDSNFRIETSMDLRPINPPVASALFD